MYIVCILQSQNNIYLTEIPESSASLLKENKRVLNNFKLFERKLAFT